ncbi:MAG: hypothetical protein A2V98_05240 [Planctomycetes bacterium RBG_16_64_12]|nr:MAG: hypothetical protein A2V98_05240 [Planctomycetes bacterium RBG_16_64_12]
MGKPDAYGYRGYRYGYGHGYGYGYRSGKSRENVHYDDKSDLHPAESTLRRRTRQEKVESDPHDSIA